jgi:hypothetical protein
MKKGIEMSIENNEKDFLPYKGSLEGIEGERVAEVEVLGGGSEFCNSIKIKLDSGKMIVFNSHINIYNMGIIPQIQYKVSKWKRWNPKKIKDKDVEGQLFFNFTDES